MKKITPVGLLLFFLLLLPTAKAQDRYARFTQTIRDLYYLTSEKELEDYWSGLVAKHHIPLIVEDSIAFLYRGDARKVVWMGDFNGWGYSKTFRNEGQRIPRTNLWILKGALPKDARVDYKILLNDSQWMVDPVNPWSQWSGVGGGSINSELRMPEWKEDPLTTQPVSGAPTGKVDKDLLFSSSQMTYQVTYSVYTPQGYESDKRYPVVYVTDGYEYMHDRMGNMVTILDNLIHLGKIQPIVAVFIDHRDPINRAVNRRMQELAINENYLNLVTRELIPLIESTYRISKEPSDRAVIGTSVGGISAAWLVFSRPDLFGMAGIQSPAFWFKPEIYNLCDKSQARPVRIFMTTGLIHDAEEGTLRMQEILDRKSCPNVFRAVNQGNSWGNWRDLLDDMLIYLFPA